MQNVILLVDLKYDFRIQSITYIYRSGDKGLKAGSFVHYLQPLNELDIDEAHSVEKFAMNG